MWHALPDYQPEDDFESLLLAEIDNAFDAFKREVVNGASVGALPGRLIKKDGS
jgi:hypothetical protein